MRYKSSLLALSFNVIYEQSLSIFTYLIAFIFQKVLHIFRPKKKVERCVVKNFLLWDSHQYQFLVCSRDTCYIAFNCTVQRMYRVVYIQYKETQALRKKLLLIRQSCHSVVHWLNYTLSLKKSPLFWLLLHLFSVSSKELGTLNYHFSCFIHYLNIATKSFKCQWIVYHIF